MFANIIKLCLAFIITFISPLVFAQTTTYVVNHAGGTGVDFTNLNACLAAINTAGHTTDTLVQFTDSSAHSYDLSPAEQTIADGRRVTFQAAQPDIVTVNGRLNVSLAGGTFSATNIRFKAPAGQWAIIHGYDGQFYTNCTFGPAGDNGVIIRSGAANSLTNCKFDTITNSALMVSGGITTATTCTWNACGRVLLAQKSGDMPADHHLTIQGGTATKNQFGYAFVVTGFKATVNNFTSTGYASAVAHDWETGSDGGPGELTFNDCNFLGVYGRAIAYYQNAPNADDKGCTITLNRCLLEARADSTADLVVMDGRSKGNNGVIVVNDSVIRHLNTAQVASGLACFYGGTILARNTVLDGTSIPVNCSSEGYSGQTRLDVDHCVIVNAKSSAVAGGDYATTSLSVTNSVIDASNTSGIDVTGENIDLLVSHNLVNAASAAMGDAAVTGDPKFVNAVLGNYHIQDGSACLDNGMPTALLYDIDGDAYDASLPDIGLDQTAYANINASRAWEIY